MKKLLFIFLAAFLFIQCDNDDTCKGDVDPACLCTADYNPVCGCDEVTYSNACAAKCSGVKNFVDGVCNKVNSIVGEWKFMGYQSQDALDMNNLVKVHAYNVSMNFTEKTTSPLGFFELSGKSSVNTFFGAYKVNGAELSLDNIGITEIAGDAAANAFENLYLKWLYGELTYEINNKNILIITSKRNGAVENLVFVK